MRWGQSGSQNQRSNPRMLMTWHLKAATIKSHPRGEVSDLDGGRGEDDDHW